MSFRCLILFILIPISLLEKLIPVEELPKYGELTLYTQSWLYLKLDDYKKGDKIYIQIRIEDRLASTTLSELTLNICETDNYKEFNKNTRQFITDYKYLEERDLYKIYYIYYTIELQGDYKYMIILTPKQFGQDIQEPEFPDSLRTVFIITHNKYDYDHDANIFAIVLIIVLFTITIIIVIIYIIKIKRSRANRANTEISIPLNSKIEANNEETQQV